MATLAKEEVTKNGELLQKECYVGKNTWKVPLSSFYGIFPPKSLEVRQTLENLIGVGIQKRWMDEYEGISISKRVQDRAKFKGPTKIWFDDNHMSNSLGIISKMTNVFLFWSTSLLLCGILHSAFLVEKSEQINYTDILCFLGYTRCKAL